MHTKEASCGCAGVYSAPIALPLYATAFEQVSASHAEPCFGSHISTFIHVGSQQATHWARHSTRSTRKRAQALTTYPSCAAVHPNTRKHVLCTHALSSFLALVIYHHDLSKVRYLLHDLHNSQTSTHSQQLCCQQCLHVTQSTCFTGCEPHLQLRSLGRHECCCCCLM